MRIPPVTARISPKCTDKISAPTLKKTTTSTIPPPPTMILIKTTFVEPENTSLILDKKTTKFIQEVTHTFLVYACTIDSTIHTALSAIEKSRQTQLEKHYMQPQPMRPSSLTRQAI